MRITVAGACAVIYPVLLAAGGTFAWLRSTDSAQYRATVNMPYNHRIGSTDLQNPLAVRLSAAAHTGGGNDTSGLYTTAMIGAGQEIKKRDLESRPVVTPGAGKIAFSVEVDPKRVNSREIDADATLTVCDGTKIISNAARVIAVFCYPGGASCTAVLEVPASDSEDIVDLVRRQRPVDIKVASVARP